MSSSTTTHGVGRVGEKDGGRGGGKGGEGAGGRGWGERMVGEMWVRLVYECMSLERRPRVRDFVEREAGSTEGVRVQELTYSLKSFTW
jgi:hypothetical protein